MPPSVHILGNTIIISIIFHVMSLMRNRDNRDYPGKEEKQLFTPTVDVEPFY